MLSAEQPKHPAVRAALDAIDKTTAGPINADIYSLGLSIVFLIEHDARVESADDRKAAGPSGDDPKIARRLGIPERPTGDTSMTQYAVLGM